jgi:pimeloyl-ACP methyl ester carboxylesterase
LVSGCGYNIQNIAAAAQPQPPEAERRNWYQYYFHSPRGRDGLAAYRNELAKLLWRLWSPSWPFDDETFAASAVSFVNDDFVDIVVHSYRHRYGYAPGDSTLAHIESQLAAQPVITVPTIVLHGADDGVDPPTAHDDHAVHFVGGYERRVLSRIGHNIPQEAPEETAAAIWSVQQAQM